MKNILFLLFTIFLNPIYTFNGYCVDHFNDYDIHYQLGNEYIKRSMIDDAITEYEKAIEINANSSKVYNNLGVAYSKKKFFDEEISAYKKAIELGANGYLIKVNNPPEKLIEEIEKHIHG